MIDVYQAANAIGASIWLIVSFVLTFGGFAAWLNHRLSKQEWS